MNSIASFDPLSKISMSLKVILFIILVFFTIFLRLYKISSIPSSFNQDESAIGFNAYSILEIGKDEWGVPFPLYFKSFGDQKLPAYIYSTLPFIKAFGLNEYAVRLPSAISGIVAVFVIFYLVFLLSQNFTFGFLSATLLSITPWHLQFSRIAFEVNFSLSGALIGTTFFILAVEKKKLYLLMVSIVFFVISLYSYNVSRLLTPLLFSSLVVIYSNKVKEFETKYLIIAVVFLILLLSPFIISFFSSAGVFSATSSLITGTDILAKSVEMRSYLISLPTWYSKLFYNKYIFILYQYIQNLALSFSGSFFFVTGSPHLLHGTGDVGVFYLFQLPLFISGLISHLLNKDKRLKIFFLWLLLAVAVLSLSKDVPNATRSYFLVIPVTIFSILGLMKLLYYLNTFKNRALKVVVCMIFIFFAIYNIQYYFLSYYFRYPYIYRTGDKILTDYLKDTDRNYKKIIIDEKSNFAYTSLLFFNKYPPSEFLSTVKRYDDRVLLMAKSWGKYEIRSIDWKKDINTPDTLLISDINNRPHDLPILKYLYFPTRQIVLSINDQIVQYPSTDFSWFIVDSNAVIREVKLRNR